MNTATPIRSVFFFILPIAVLFSGPAAGLDFVVDSLADTFDETPGDERCEAYNGDGCTLRAAIQEANSSPGTDSIKIAVTGVIEIFYREYALRVSESVVIAGPGASELIIVGRDSEGIFRFDSSGSGQSYVLSGLTLTSGQSRFGGGAVYLGMGDKLEIESVSFSGNKTGIGGAIRSDGGILHINNSQFEDNSAQQAGAIYASSGALEVRSTTFDQNSASGAGGVIYAQRSSVEIDRSTFSSNDSGYKGGAIIAQGGTLFVRDSTFQGNLANSHGGAISLTHGATVTLSGSSLIGNVAGAEGGGIHNDSGQIIMVNSMFFDNKAKNAGGGLYSDSPNTAWIRNSTIHQNSAASGGGVFLPQNNLIRNTIISGNDSEDCNRPLSFNAANLSSDDSCGFFGETDFSSTDPLLGPLASNGGPTKTLALLPGSPAIDSGDNLPCPEVDQTGFRRSRSERDACDIGAFEAR